LKPLYLLESTGFSSTTESPFVSAKCQVNTGSSGPVLRFPHKFPHTAPYAVLARVAFPNIEVLTGYPLQFLARPDPTAPPHRPEISIGTIRAPLHLVLLK
jgi:hypothetical protein